MDEETQNQVIAQIKTLEARIFELRNPPSLRQQEQLRRDLQAYEAAAADVRRQLDDLGPVEVSSDDLNTAMQYQFEIDRMRERLAEN